MCCNMELQQNANKQLLFIFCLDSSRTRQWFTASLCTEGSLAQALASTCACSYTTTMPLQPAPSKTQVVRAKTATSNQSKHKRTHAPTNANIPNMTCPRIAHTSHACSSNPCNPNTNTHAFTSASIQNMTCPNIANTSHVQVNPCIPNTNAHASKAQASKT